MTLPLSGTNAARANVRLSVPWDRRRVGLTLFFFFTLLASVVSLRFIRFSPLELYRGLTTSGYFGRALPPSFFEWHKSLNLVVRTFMMAVAGTGLAGLLSVPLGVLAARSTAPSAWVARLARLVIVAARAIPDLIWAVFFVAALSIGELPGVLALGVHSIGMLGKLLADSIEELDDGPRQAALAAGATRFQAATNAVLPQVLPSYVGNLLYRLDINTRVSVVLGFVGAGGIGFELRGNLRNPLRYPVGIGQAIMVFGLVLLVDRAASLTRRALDGAVVVRSNDRETEVAAEMAAQDRRAPLRPPWTFDRKILGSISAVMVTGFVWCSTQVGLNPLSLIRALAKSASILKLFWPPDFSKFQPEITQGFKETLAIGMAATFIGVTAAIPFALLVARTTTPNRFVGAVARFVQVVLRSIPELVIVLLFVSAVGLGPVPGAAALSIGTFSFMSKLLADSLESVPQGPMEGVRASGASRPQEVASAVAPQMVPSLVSNGLYNFDVNVRSSSVLGIVGAGGIGRILDETLSLLMYRTVAAVIIILFVIVMMIEQLSIQVRRHLL